MRTVDAYLDGVRLAVPDEVDFPYDSVEEFPHTCGPGKGIGEFIIPESLLGLKVSAACFLHDKFWELCHFSKEDFEQTNKLFLSNMRSIINCKTPLYSWRLPARHLVAFWYYRAVSSRAGWFTFVKYKMKQTGIL